MLAGQITAPGTATTADVPKPEPGPDDVLIKVHRAGICGTDIHILKGEYEAVYPLVPGHEFSGEVEAVGENVTNFKPGDRVTADPNVPCNRCVYCKRNEPNQCLNLAPIGVGRDGGFAEYVTAPEGVVFNIGDMPYDTAALIEPLACVAWGLKRVQVQPGATALVLGAGPMGCLLAQAVRRMGASRVVVTDVVQWRLDLAAELGATDTVLADENQTDTLKKLEPHGFDLVADASGVPSVIAGMFQYARPRGTVWIFGVVPMGTTVQWSPYDAFRKDLTVIGSFAVNRTFPESIAMLNGGLMNVAPLISHTLPLRDFAQGFDLAQNDPKRMKVQFAVT